MIMQYYLYLSHSSHDSLELTLFHCFFSSMALRNFWLPPFTFNLPRQLSPELAINYEEQLKMMDAFLAAAPMEKKECAKDLLFIMLFETRQGAAAFIAAAAAGTYGFALPLEQRHPLHFLFFVLSMIMAAANANHGFSVPFGNHPHISVNGWAVGTLFTPFWLASAYCNWVGFTLSKKAAAAGGNKRD